MRLIVDLEPDATALLTWRWPADAGGGPVESLVLGALADQIQPLASAILAGAADPQTRPRPATPGARRSDGIFAPFTLTDRTADTYLCAVLELCDDDPARLAVCLRQPCSAIPRAVADLLAPLHPTMRRAMRVLLDQRKLVDSRRQAIALADILAEPSLLLDADALVLARNSNASRLLADASLASIARYGRLSLASPEQNDALRRTLATLSTQPGTEPIALRLQDATGHGQHWLVVSASAGGAVSPGAPDACDRACPQRFAVVFKSVDDGELVSVPVLRRAFNLTATEAHLVAALTSGLTIKDHAQAIGRTENTVRWHLGNVLEKMGCRNQTDVVRLVLRVLVT